LYTSPNTLNLLVPKIIIAPSLPLGFIKSFLLYYNKTP
jgi:hypothetical protein